MASKKAAGKLLSPFTNPCYEVSSRLFLFFFGFFYHNFMDFELLINSSDQALAAEFPRDFLGMSLPEQPNKYYFILRAHKIVLEADSSIQLIMDKLQSYKSRVALNFEVFSFTSLFNSIIL